MSGGNQPHKASYLRGLPVNPAGHSGGGERTNPGGGSLGPSTGPLLLATPGEAGGRGRAGGDTGEEGRVGRKAEKSDRRRKGGNS